MGGAGDRRPRKRTRTRKRKMKRKGKRKRKRTHTHTHARTHTRAQRSLPKKPAEEGPAPAHTPWRQAAPLGRLPRGPLPLPLPTPKALEINASTK